MDDTIETGLGWSVFGLELPARVVAALRADAEARYPQEACGLVLGPAQAKVADRVVPLQNVSREKGRFAFDDKEHLMALERADEEGRVERIIYHSHPDAGAYLSAVDRAAIAPGGHPLLPDVVHVVVEVRRGKSGEIAAFRWDPEWGGFEEAHPVPPMLPDLELRGGPSQRPVAAVGGQLAGRRLGPSEAVQLAPLAEGRRLRIDARTATLVSFFERGFLSPLTGFQRPDEARTVVALGRTPRGVPWRSPLTLEVDRAPMWPTGQIIELEAPDGRAVALMVVAERREQRGGVVLGGPLFVYPSQVPDARDFRAEWLAMGAERILAIPSVVRDDVETVEADAFDALLVGTEVAGTFREGRWPVHPLAELEDDLWLTAAMAQNQGATHIWLPLGPERSEIARTLAITPCGPELM